MASSSFPFPPPLLTPTKPQLQPLTCSLTPPSSPTFDLRPYWSTLITTINTSLDAAIPVTHPASIFHSMRYSVLAPAAKRAPPVMCVAAACDLLSLPPAAALPTACGLEMVHAASLVHDDLPCMDAAAERRGRPSCHKVFGTHSAVLAGDALFPLAFRHIVTNTPPELVGEEKVLRVVAEIARAVGAEGMAAGQYLDLRGGADVDVLEVLEKKFGEMAECSAVCGGLLGGASEEVLECLRRYGRAVGVLYQVVDDVLMEEDGNGGKMRSNVSVVKAYGMEKALKIVEELRQKAKKEVRALEEEFGVERVMPLSSFVDYAVERGFGVEGGSEDTADAMAAQK